MPKIKFQLTANWEREEDERYIQYIKARIRDARENHTPKMTQAELAEKLGRTQAYFSKLEKGELVPSIVEMLGIAQHTQTPIQFFLPIQDIKEDQLNGMEWRLLSSFRSIEDNQRKEIVIDTAKKFAETKKVRQK
ncbi:MAG: helix-turn-helix transcriptional regulator [Chloroflexi bacterium]|nr:helix-turn-helix transcriptional regulator [Chloroflexota bacterium]